MNNNDFRAYLAADRAARAQELQEMEEQLAQLRRPRLEIYRGFGEDIYRRLAELEVRPPLNELAALEARPPLNELVPLGPLPLPHIGKPPFSK
jgi:hypothetical protein